MTVYDFSSGFNLLNQGINSLGEALNNRTNAQGYAGIGQAVQQGDWQGASARAWAMGNADLAMKLQMQGYAMGSAGGYPTGGAGADGGAAAPAKLTPTTVDASGKAAAPAGGSSGVPFMDSVARIESDNQNRFSGVDKDYPGQPGSRSQGYFQIDTPTWQQFAPKAGVDVSQYPTAMNAPRDVQQQVAAQIPLARFGPRTQKMLADQYGNLDKSQPLGVLAGRFKQADLPAAGARPTGLQGTPDASGFAVPRFSTGDTIGSDYSTGDSFGGDPFAGARAEATGGPFTGARASAEALRPPLPPPTAPATGGPSVTGGAFGGGPTPPQAFNTTGMAGGGPVPPATATTNLSPATSGGAPPAPPLPQIVRALQSGQVTMRQLLANPQAYGLPDPRQPQSQQIWQALGQAATGGGPGPTPQAPPMPAPAPRPPQPVAPAPVPPAAPPPAVPPQGAPQIPQAYGQPPAPAADPSVIARAGLAGFGEGAVPGMNTPPARLAGAPGPDLSSILPNWLLHPGSVGDAVRAWNASKDAQAKAAAPAPAPAAAPPPAKLPSLVGAPPPVPAPLSADGGKAAAQPPPSIQPKSSATAPVTGPNEPPGPVSTGRGGVGTFASDFGPGAGQMWGPQGGVMAAGPGGITPAYKGGPAAQGVSPQAIQAALNAWRSGGAPGGTTPAALPPGGGGAPGAAPGRGGLGGALSGLGGGLLNLLSATPPQGVPGMNTPAQYLQGGQNAPIPAPPWATQRPPGMPPGGMMMPGGGAQPMAAPAAPGAAGAPGAPGAPAAPVDPIDAQINAATSRYQAMRSMALQAGIWNPERAKLYEDEANKMQELVNELTKQKAAAGIKTGEVATTTSAEMAKKGMEGLETSYTNVMSPGGPMGLIRNIDRMKADLPNAISGWGPFQKEMQDLGASLASINMASQGKVAAGQEFDALAAQETLALSKALVSPNRLNRQEFQSLKDSNMSLAQQPRVAGYMLDLARARANQMIETHNESVSRYGDAYPNYKDAATTRFTVKPEQITKYTAQPPGASPQGVAGEGQSRVGGGAAPVPVASPADAMKLAPGTRIQLPDGRIGTVPGRVQ